MDPNANLQELLRLADAFVNDGPERHKDPERMAELVVALDEWMTRGGFLPTRWNRGR